MSSFELTVNAPVTVDWGEVNCSFSGIVKSVNEDGSCDVLYDENVGGKPCMEKNISSERIHPLMTPNDEEGNYWKDLDDSTPPSSRKRGRPKSSPKVEVDEEDPDAATTVARLLQLDGESGDGDVTAELRLGALEAIALHDALTPQTVSKLTARTEAATERANKIAELLCSCVHSCISTECPPFVEQWSEYAPDGGSKQQLKEWIQTSAAAADSALSAARSVLCSGAALLRLNTATIRRSQQHAALFSSGGTGASSTSLAEETVDHTVRYGYALLQSNFLSSAAQALLGAAREDTARGSSGTGGGRGGVRGKGKENLTERAVAEMAKIVLPGITSLLNALVDNFTVQRPSAKLLASTLELALAALKVDPVSHSALEALQAQQHVVLVAFHRAASALTAAIFALTSNASQRKGVLVELLGMLNQVYSAKAPYRSYLLQQGSASSRNLASSTAAASAGTHTSMVYATLLLCVQSAVAVQDCLPNNLALLSASDPSPEPDSPKSSAKKGKGASKKVAKKISDGAMSDKDVAVVKGAGGVAVLPSKETASRSLYPTYASCAMFVAELFQRCTNKDVSAEYRSLCAALVGETLSVLQQPTFPAAAILLEQTVLSAVKQLGLDGSATTVGAGSNAKRDTTYTVFLLDTLGTVCVGVRGIMLTAEREEKEALLFRLSPEVEDCLSRKVGDLKYQWLQSSAKLLGAETSLSGGSQRATPVKGGGEPRGLDVSTALSALLQVTASTVDALLEQPQDQEYGEDTAAAGVRYSTALSTLPPPVRILQQLPQHAELLSRFPTLAQVDLQYFHVCAYLHAQDQQQQEHTSGSRVADCSGSSAYAMTLALWFANAVTDERHDVAVYVRKLLAAHSASARSSSSVVGGYGATAAQSAVLAPDSVFNDMDGASTGVNTIEAVSSASRGVLLQRTVATMFERVLAEILHMTSEAQPTVRAKAVRVLSPLLQCDNHLIQRDHVREVLTSRLYDSAISVREEAVKILGYYVVRGYANLSAEYLTGLQERLHDEGISVRKSVVLLFKEILLNQPDHPQYVPLCQALLAKAAHPKEEESIKEVVRLIFQQIWFLPPSASVIQSGLRSRQQSGLFDSSSNLTQQLGLGPGVGVAAMEGTGSPRTPHASMPSASATVTPQGHHADVGLSLSIDALSAPQLARSDSLASGVATVASTNSAAAMTPALSRHSSAQKLQAPHSACSSTLTSPKIAMRDHVRSIALQLIDIAALDDTTADWMVTLLRELLHGTSEGDDTAAALKQRRASSFKYCEQIVNSLVELLICTEEQQPEIVQQLQIKGRDAKTQVACIINTIALFCQAHPPFIGRHLATLLPYLKQDSTYTREQNALITLKVTEVLAHAALLDTSHFAFDLSAVVTDLKRCALTQAGRNIKAAIHALAVLAENVTHDAEPVYQLAETCFRGIKGIASAIPDPTQLNAGHIGNLQRLLIVFGYICECVRKCPKALREYTGSIQPSTLSATMRKLLAQPKADNTVALKDISEVEALHPSILYGTCYSAAIYALTVPVPAVQIRGAQALCGVFSGCPRLMLLAQEEGLLGALLGDGYDDTVHERFLVALKDMMLVEEARLASEQALRQMKDSGVAVIERDAVMSNSLVDAESSIPGFAIQQHFAALTQFVNHRTASLRLASLGLVGTLLRQGMLSPLDVIAPLIAMQGDCEQRIREEALLILQVIDERHPTFLGNRMVDGVEQCHAFQTAAMGHTFAALPDDMHGTAASVFQGFYATCVQAPRRRRELLDGIVSRAYGLLGRLREQVGQCAGSFEAVMQQQALARAEQELQLQQQQQGEIGGASVPHSRTLARTPSLPRITATKPVDSKQLTQLLTEAYDKPPVGAFLASALAHLPYDTADEPLEVVYYINRNVAVGTALLLSRLKEQFLTMGGELRKAGSMQPPALGSRPKGSKVTSKIAAEQSPADGETELALNEAAFAEWLSQYSDEKCTNSSKSATVAAVRLTELLLLTLQLRCNESILRLKAYLKAVYAFSDERCASYSPDSLNSSTPNQGGDRLGRYADMDFAASPTEAVGLHTILSAEQLVASASSSKAASSQHAQQALVSVLRIVAADYNRVTHLLNDEAADFTLVAGTGAGVGGKRKRRAPSTVATGSGGEGTKRGGGAGRGRPPSGRGAGRGAGRGRGGGRGQSAKTGSGRKKARKASGSGVDSSSGEEDMVWDGASDSDEEDSFEA